MEIVDRRVPLSEIGKTVGPAPVPRFIANVRRNGVVIPILLREVVGEHGAVEYRIVDGNRRVAASRKARLRDIPARILIGVSVDEAARLVFIANNFRSQNELTEFLAIRHLDRSGVSSSRIAQAAGLTVKSLALRERWSRLDRRVLRGFSEGKISGSVASRIVRMTPTDQRHFGDLFEVKGRIRTVDVQDYLGIRDTSPGPSHMMDDVVPPELVPGARSRSEFLPQTSSGGIQTGTPHRYLGSEPLSAPLQHRNPALATPGPRAVGQELTQPQDPAWYGVTADHLVQNQEHSALGAGLVTREESYEPTDDTRPVPSRARDDDPSRSHDLRENETNILSEHEEPNAKQRIVESFPPGVAELSMTGHPSVTRRDFSQALPANRSPEPTPREIAESSMSSPETGGEPITILKTDTIRSSPPPVTRYERTFEPAGRKLPADVQQVIEQVANLGYTKGYSLAHLTDALAIAYRQVAFVEKTFKEETRG